MDQDSANLDLSLSQRAYLHEAVGAEDGKKSKKTPNPIPVFVCLQQGCELSFPTAKLLEAHTIIHANGKQTPNAIDDFSIAAGHWSPHRLHYDFGYNYPTIHTASFCTFNDAPTEVYEPIPGWQNPINAIGIRDHGLIDPVGIMPSSTLPAIGEGTFTQGFDPSGIASHGPYAYGHSQLATAAPPLTHAVAQTSNVANATASAQPGVICVQCGTHVGRQSDLGRHMKKHQPDAEVFRCQVQGCQYSSKRKDKLMEHSRRPH